MARPQRHTQAGLESGQGGDIGVGGTPEQATHGALVHPTDPGSLTSTEIPLGHRLGQSTDDALGPDRLDGRIRLELPVGPFLASAQPLHGGTGPGPVHTAIVRVSNMYRSIPDPGAVPPIPASASPSSSTSTGRVNSSDGIHLFPPRLGVIASHWGSWWVRGRLESLHSDLRAHHDRSSRAGGAR